MTIEEILKELQEVSDEQWNRLDMSTKEFWNILVANLKGTLESEEEDD